MSDLSRPARAEAVALAAHAMSLRWFDENIENDSDPEYDAETALDAIPTAALAALLLERGGLVQVGWQGTDAENFFVMDSDPEGHADDLADANLRPVYRLSEEPT